MAASTLNKRTVYLSSIFKWYDVDFPKDDEILKWILNFLNATKSGPQHKKREWSMFITSNITAVLKLCNIRRHRRFKLQIRLICTGHRARNNSLKVHQSLKLQILGISLTRSPV